MLRIVSEGSTDFAAAWRRLLDRGATDLEAVEPDVRAILAQVRAEGDRAVIALTERFDRHTPSPLFTTKYDGAGALSRLDPELRAALELATQRIASYHERQLQSGFRFEEDGITLGMRVRPLARVGVYAPGGKARYPSSVLMTAVPAKVAGVREIVLATLAPNDVLLAAAHLGGVTAILDAGGAQAIGALAYGTESVPKVDKIVGPGNRYVACAKRLVFGEVGIEGIAGPTEILVLCDASAEADLVAADLIAQAEHDEAAYPLCVTTDARLAEKIVSCVEEQLATLPRKPIAKAAIDDNGLIVVASSRSSMIALGTALAAEHVAIHTEEADELFEQLGAAGAAFVGHATPEAAGDYLAGPSHVLPTGGAARYASPLGVYDFVTRCSYLRYETSALARQVGAIGALARVEGLEGHARAAERRR